MFGFTHGENKKRLNSALTALERVLGWAVQRKCSTRCRRINCNHAVVLRRSIADRETAPIFKPFRELESIGISLWLETNWYERSFKETPDSIKSANGGCEVRLPWKKEVELAGNRFFAEKWYRQLTKQLFREPSRLNVYDNEMKWLLAEGVAESELHSTDYDCQRIYYMLHQPVLRESSISLSRYSAW